LDKPPVANVALFGACGRKFKTTEVRGNGQTKKCDNN